MKRITLRLPDEIADAIEELAKENARSFNNEIAQALKYYTQMMIRRKQFDKEFQEMKEGNFDEL